ncbi:hypothetical protein NDK43_05315 [Neobacillus pocheonensis]|uniref:LPXTG cell wall anchor domain-containing protein n=1 Tax=Neobacillus pocheonensis TaxID=363869 RepID=A0ABT0W6G5_9BACI|nr:hypothetical protein [Neobacillus pocheonensis]
MYLNRLIIMYFLLISFAFLFPPSTAAAADVVAPTTLGNEFQGLDCELEFRFTSQGILAGVPVTPGVALPSTSTNMFNLLGTGFLLILGGIQFQLQ